jgi:hypothetical protein
LYGEEREEGEEEPFCISFKNGVFGFNKLREKEGEEKGERERERGRGREGGRKKEKKEEMEGGENLLVISLKSGVVVVFGFNQLHESDQERK